MAGDMVLVTGAGGFIGSHLVEALLQRGHNVRAFVRYTSTGTAAAVCRLYRATDTGPLTGSRRTRVPRGTISPNLLRTVTGALSRITAIAVEATEFPDLSRRYMVTGVPKTVVNETVEILGALPQDDFVQQALTLPTPPPV